MPLVVTSARDPLQPHCTESVGLQVAHLVPGAESGGHRMKGRGQTPSTGGCSSHLLFQYNDLKHEEARPATLTPATTHVITRELLKTPSPCHCLPGPGWGEPPTRTLEGVHACSLVFHWTYGAPGASARREHDVAGVLQGCPSFSQQAPHYAEGSWDHRHTGILHTITSMRRPRPPSSLAPSWCTRGDL